SFSAARHRESQLKRRHRKKKYSSSAGTYRGSERLAAHAIEAVRIDGFHLAKPLGKNVKYLIPDLLTMFSPTRTRSWKKLRARLSISGNWWTYAQRAFTATAMIRRLPGIIAAFHSRSGGRGCFKTSTRCSRNPCHRIYC